MYKAQKASWAILEKWVPYSSIWVSRLVGLALSVMVIVSTAVNKAPTSQGLPRRRHVHMKWKW